MDNNCHISNLVQAISYVENCGLNLVLKLAKPLTCMIVASNFIILTTMREPKQTNILVKNIKIEEQQSILQLTKRDLDIKS